LALFQHFGIVFITLEQPPGFARLQIGGLHKGRSGILMVLFHIWDRD
jgi:hypothetical protein